MEPLKFDQRLQEVRLCVARYLMRDIISSAEKNDSQLITRHPYLDHINFDNAKEYKEERRKE